MKLRERLHEAESEAVRGVLTEAALSEVLDDVADVLTAGHGSGEIVLELRNRATKLRELAQDHNDHSWPAGCAGCAVLDKVGEFVP